jgi:hypothetical protein
MHCLIENRVYALLPWVEQRRTRALKRGDRAAVFLAVALEERLRLLENGDNPSYSHEAALTRFCQRNGSTRAA